MPRAVIGSLCGTQYQKAALRAVPPSSGAFSRRTTSSPSQRLNSAAGSPPPPPPTTTTSACTSTGPVSAGRAVSRTAIPSEPIVAPSVVTLPRRLGGGDLRGEPEELAHRRAERGRRIVRQRVAAPCDHAVGPHEHGAGLLDLPGARPIVVGVEHLAAGADDVGGDLDARARRDGLGRLDPGVAADAGEEREAALPREIVVGDPAA